VVPRQEPGVLDILAVPPVMATLPLVLLPPIRTSLSFSGLVMGSRLAMVSEAIIGGIEVGGVGA
jgi:hypothetical protein